MTCKTCEEPEFAAGGNQDGCLAWRRTDILTIAIGDLSAEFSFTALRDTRITSLAAALTSSLTAPNFALLTVTDEEGDVIVDAADLSAFTGLASGAPSGVAWKRPVFDTVVHRGQTAKVKVSLDAAEAAAISVLVMLSGRTDDGCADGACIVADQPQCKGFVTSQAFTSGAGALPDDDAIRPTAPMTVYDVFVSAAVTLDGDEVSTQLSISQEGDMLSQSTDARVWSQDNIAQGPFRMREASNNKPVNIAWGGDAQAAANVFLVTLSGTRRHGCGC